MTQWRGETMKLNGSGSKGPETIQIVKAQIVFGQTLTVYGDEQHPMFLANEVGKWIEHSNTRMMLKSIDEEEKGVNNVYTPGGVQEMWFLTEDGLYEVLMQSRKPIAREFKKKVKEILKELRKGNQVLINTGNAQADLFTQLMSASMQAISQVLNQNMVSFKEEIKREMVDTRNIITEQEIIHKKQLQEARDLIGFKKTTHISFLKDMVKKQNILTLKTIIQH